MRILIIFFTLFFFNYANAENNFATRPEVKTFIHKMVKKYHFKEAELVKIFKAVKVRPTVIQSVKAPLEKKPWHTYQTLFVTEWRIKQGVEFWKKYHDTLARAEKMYGVPASIIVATIGVETKYGQHTGEYRVIDALVNLGFSDSPRAPFFRNELAEFFLLAREQHLDPLKIKGSYAGAIGQPQFMPSSYRYYAVNFSHSGKIDLSHNEVDVIGSIANYYKKHGWKTNQPVTVPTTKDENFITHLQKDKKATLIELDGFRGKEYWVGYHNFGVIKRYNPSDLYAMAVYQLSHYIVKLKGKSNA